jgi:hypothetical protein
LLLSALVRAWPLDHNRRQGWGWARAGWRFAICQETSARSAHALCLASSAPAAGCYVLCAASCAWDSQPLDERARTLVFNVVYPLPYPLSSPSTPPIYVRIQIARATTSPRPGQRSQPPTRGRTQRPTASPTEPRSATLALVQRNGSRLILALHSLLAV